MVAEKLGQLVSFLVVSGSVMIAIRQDPGARQQSQDKHERRGNLRGLVQLNARRELAFKYKRPSNSIK